MLNILYTQNLRGNLALLPRLYTFMRSLKDEGRAIVLDLGGSCDDAVWHCQATAGRSTLIALDGMGYHGANINGALDTVIAQKLAEQVALRLCDGDTLKYVDADSGLEIMLKADKKTALNGNILTLQAVNAGQIGQVIVQRDSLAVHRAKVHTVPESALPDPTIAGVIDFIIGEARFYQKRREER